MSITIFPAQPGTFMIERDASVSPVRVVKVPVIGWNHVQGNMAFPVCVMNHGGLTHGKAILHPEGFVTDSVHGLTFETEAEWSNYMKTAKATGKPASAPQEPDEPAEMPGDAIDDADEPDVENGEDAMNEKVGPIRFGRKTYSTNSFWSMPLAHAVFQIEGGQHYPKDPRCEKVKRDEFAALKRAGATVIDPHSGEIGGAAEPEDDDDAMDLV
mgnify:CR=1 FL=1